MSQSKGELKNIVDEQAARIEELEEALRQISNLTEDPGYAQDYAPTYESLVQIQRRLNRIHTIAFEALEPGETAEF